MPEGTNKRGKKEHKEYGAVMLAEAAFVFPVMFIIVFVMIMAGGAYFQHARVERLVVEAALDGAARCENPMLEQVSKTGSVPTGTSDGKVMPYRYLLTGNARNIGNEVADELKRNMEGLQSFVFRGLEPKHVTVRAMPHMYIILSNFEVECEFDIELPIRMLFSEKNVTFHYSVCMTEPIGDPAEFVRNVSTVQDFAQRNEVLAEAAQKFKEAAQKLGTYIN